jgi:hypothetical protein
LAIPRVVTQSTSSPESEIISAPDTSSVTTEKRIHNIIDDFQNFMKEFDQIVSDRPITEEDKRSWTRRIDELIKNKLYPTVKVHYYSLFRLETIFNQNFIIYRLVLTLVLNFSMKSCTKCDNNILKVTRSKQNRRLSSKFLQIYHLFFS